MAAFIVLVSCCEHAHCGSTDWDKLGAGGSRRAQQCGWLKDRYGLSWHVVPTVLLALMQHPGRRKQRRVMQALLQMKKLDIEGLKQAAA